MAQPQQPTQRPPQGPPSSQQMQMGPAPKILRIGVILGDKIVEERLVRGLEPVTIGQSAKNMFAVPTPQLPKTWTVFQHQGGRVVLNVSDAMDGRLSDGGQVMTIGQLKQTGRAQRAGQGWLIPLSDSARGKVVVGDMTLLFQFVTAPPLQPRPQLPASVRGSVFDDIDAYLVSSLAVSLLFFGFVFSYYKWIADPPREIPPDEIPAQFAKILMEKPIAPEPQPVADGKGEGEETKTGEEDKGTEDKGKKNEHPDEPAGGGSSDTASAEQKVARTAVVRVLGSQGGGGSAFFDVTGGKDIGSGLDKTLARLGESGEGIAASGGGGSSLEAGVSGGGAGGGIAEGKQTGVTGPTGPKTTGTDKVEKEVRGSGSTGDIEGESSGGLDPGTFSETLKKRWYPQALACYTRVLKTNPTIGGKVEVSLTVGVGGNVTKISVNGFNSEVDACIERAARTSWRFPKPEDASTFDFSFVFRKAN